MAGEKFYFIFSEEPNTKYYIDEPINFADVDFILEQKENRMGRDESLNGGENRFRFTDYRNHYLDKLLYSYHSRGFEVDIILGIVTALGAVYESELHFVDVETDELTYLECRTISKSSQQIIKSRRETKVDMFSSVDIDGNYIAPLVQQNMLLKAKPTIQFSEWSQINPVEKTFLSYGLDSIEIVPVENIIKSGIENTLIPLNVYQESSLNLGIDSFFEVLDPLILFESQSNLKNAKVTLKGITANISDIGGGLGTKKYLQVVWSKTFNAGDIKGQFIIPNTFGAINVSNQDYEITIPEMERGTKLAILFGVNSRYTTPSTSPVSNTSIKIACKSITIETESTAYNSIIPTFRLIDVMKQVIKSISGNELYSQRYNFAGEFYDNVLFNGNLMRNETDKPFYVSLDDIEKSIWGEHKGDTEVKEDGSVFVGIEKDFYTNIECGFFDDTQFDEMVKNTNQKYALNEFKFKYGKYQSLKEETQPNSESTIHGESIWTFFNKRAPNKLEANVEWVRDAILIDTQQRLATKISEDTATQDDDTIFCVDVLPTVEDRKFTETTSLQHTANEGNLLLRGSGDVNFVTLGIKEFTTFIIETPNINAGTYIVQSVSNNQILLSGIIPSPVNDGIKSTNYTYEIKKETIPLTNRTDEGFTAISNLIAPDKYSNLRYSIKRNIINYWNSTLATVNLFWKDKPLRSTYYKNNGKCSTTYAGLTVIENEPFVPDNPIVSPYIYDNLTFVNVDFDDYITLRNKIKKDRGYIRAINKNMRVIKVYPQKVTYVNADKKLMISGEEKFEKAYLTISNEGGIILVNNETSLIRLDYSIENNEVSLFDKERFRLYNPVFWDKVTVNGANAETIEQLISWLDLLS